MSEMVFLRRNLPLVERFPQYYQKDDFNGINQVGQKIHWTIYFKGLLFFVHVNQ